MAIEAIRGCGYRKVNALYIVGEYISSPCDRMPFPLTVCPVCGQGIKVSRAFTEINPLKLWGSHDSALEQMLYPNYQAAREAVDQGKDQCQDRIRPCHLCDPQDQPAYIMLVGAGAYKTPFDFLDEAKRMGISKRIPFIPKGLELGKTVLYLAHPKACEVMVEPALQQAMAIVSESQTKQPRLLETDRKEKALGIFCAFIPKRVERLIWKSKASPEELEKLEKRGISPVIIADGDKDHA